MLMFGFSIPVLVLAIAYWAAAFEILNNACGCEYWVCSPPGQFLPWPWAPKGCADVVVPMSSVDGIFCNLATSGLFIAVVLAEVVSAAWVGRLVGKMLERRQDLRRNRDGN